MAALRSRLAVALAAIGVAFAAFVGGDHGAARAAIGNATGPLIGSPLAGAAILAAHGMAPGEVKVGYINVSNIGDMSGTFALGSTGLTDTPLSHALDLTVEDVTPGHAATLVYSGKLASLSSVGLGDMAQGATHRFRFSVGLPSDADDRYQGASSAVTFMWSATAPDVVSTPAPTPTPTPSATPGATKAAPATTAESPGKATTAGTTVKPGATLSARARQKGTAGKVSATVTCRSSCRVVLSGTATAGPVKVKLKTVKRKLAKAKRVTIRMTLPARARLALAGGRPVTVRLSLKATIGTRVVTVRRTVRIASASQ